MKYQRDEGLDLQILSEMMAEIDDPTRQHPSVTDLIYCLTKSAHDSWGSKAEPSRQTKLYFTIGLGLEKALLSGRKVEPIAGVFEGIHYHLDSIDNDVLTELKTTRIGVKKTPDEFPQGWLKQIMAYCYVTNRTTAKLVVLHVIQPEIQSWELEFTPEEVASNWNWLRSRRETWEYFRDREEYPTQFTYNEAWECKECVYKLVCDARQMTIGYTLPLKNY